MDFCSYPTFFIITVIDYVAKKAISIFPKKGLGDNDVNYFV